MRGLFWEEIVKIREVTVQINKLGVKEEEKFKLLEVVYQTFNVSILDTVLSELPEKKQKEFLAQLSEKPHSPKIIESLKEEVKDIEEKIIQAAQRLKEKILQQLEDL